MAYPGIIQQVKDLFASLSAEVTNRENAVAALSNSLVDRIYPVGSIYMSMNSTNPATLLGGGVWEALPTGRVLVGAGTGYTAGGTGGNKTVTLTVDQMPSHSHANTLAAAGGHSHSRGSMEITGNIMGDAINSIGDSGYANALVFHAEGAFWNTLVTGSFAAYTPTGSQNTWRNNFAASRTWAGATSTVANHNHTITNASTGGGSAVNIEQPWLAVYMWKRTK